MTLRRKGKGREPDVPMRLSLTERVKRLVQHSSATPAVDSLGLSRHIDREARVESLVAFSTHH